MGISTFLLSPTDSKKPNAMQKSCFSGFRPIDSSLIGTPRGIDAVLAYVTEVKAGALVTLSDVHTLWLSANVERFQGICKVMVPSLRCLELADSKKTQVQLAEDAGFCILPTYVIRQATDIEEIEGSNYPLCLRPAAPGAAKPGFKAKVVLTPAELKEFVSGVQFSGDGLIAQPFRPIPNAVVHCTSDANGDLLNCKAFLVDRKFEGLSLRMRPMPLPKDLLPKVEAFSRKLGISGPFHFDFLHSPETGEWYYLEVNVRFGGTTDKALWLGVNEPANCFLAYGLTVPHPPRNYATLRSAVVNKRSIVKHIVTMLRHSPDPLDYPSDSRLMAVLSSFGDLLFAKDSIFDVRDLRGTIAFHLQGIHE